MPTRRENNSNAVKLHLYKLRPRTNCIITMKVENYKSKENFKVQIRFCFLVMLLAQKNKLFFFFFFFKDCWLVFLQDSKLTWLHCFLLPWLLFLSWLVANLFLLKLIQHCKEQRSHAGQMCDIWVFSNVPFKSFKAHLGSSSLIIFKMWKNFYIIIKVIVTLLRIKKPF